MATKLLHKGAPLLATYDFGSWSKTEVQANVTPRERRDIAEPYVLITACSVPQRNLR
jgi:hypothetical protein